jgi:hypothetical protein
MLEVEQGLNHRSDGITAVMLSQLQHHLSRQCPTPSKSLRTAKTNCLDRCQPLRQNVATAYLSSNEVPKVHGHHWQGEVGLQATWCNYLEN